MLDAVQAVLESSWFGQGRIEFKDVCLGALIGLIHAGTVVQDVVGFQLRGADVGPKQKEDDGRVLDMRNQAILNIRHMCENYSKRFWHNGFEENFPTKAAAFAMAFKHYIVIKQKKRQPQKFHQ